MKHIMDRVERDPVIKSSKSNLKPIVTQKETKKSNKSTKKNKNKTDSEPITIEVNNYKYYDNIYYLIFVSNNTDEIYDVITNVSLIDKNDKIKDSIKVFASGLGGKQTYVYTYACKYKAIRYESDTKYRDASLTYDDCKNNISCKTTENKDNLLIQFKNNGKTSCGLTCTVVYYKNDKPIYSDVNILFELSNPLLPNEKYVGKFYYPDDVERADRYEYYLTANHLKIQ